MKIKENSPMVTHLLNRAKAIIELKMGTLSELGESLGYTAKATYGKPKRWVDYRNMLPNGEAALGIERWVQAKEMALYTPGEPEKSAKTTRKYARALAKIEKEFPSGVKWAAER